MTYHTPVEAHFFCPRKTKPKASETCLKARNPPGLVICNSKNIKGMAPSHQIRPKAQKGTQPIQIPNSCLPKQHQQIQNNSKKERENGSHVMPISLLFWRGAQGIKGGSFPRWKRRIPRLHNYGKGLVFFINQQLWHMPPEKWSAATSMETINDEEGSWSSPLSTGHGRLRHKTIRSNIS